MTATQQNNIVLLAGLIPLMVVVGGVYSWWRRR
jgi:LPXTG-motif cell wall-anchored protein